jgi:Fe2+ or Zn2+ uptake regulation protein
MEKRRAQDLLKEHKLRATPNRMKVLQFVEDQKLPVGIDVLSTQFPDLNEVTLYRMASDFVEKGIWNTYDLGHGHLDFEASNRPHHHHAVCEGCGMVEDIFSCKQGCTIRNLVSKASEHFSEIRIPSAPVFGTCKQCA